MKRVLNKVNGLIVLFSIIFTLFVPILVSASNYVLGEGIGNLNASTNELYQYNVNPNEVTLYIGDISINHGCKHDRYLYTDKEVNEQTLGKIRDILTIDYKKLLPDKPGQILVNNFNADMSSGNWKNAYDIAIKRYKGSKIEEMQYPDKTIYYKATLTKLRRESRQECDQEKQNILQILDEKEKQNVAFDHFVFNGSVNLVDGDSFMVDAVKESEAKTWILNGEVKTLNEKLNYNSVNHNVKVFDIDRTIVKVVSTSANVKLPKKISEIKISIDRPIVGQEINYDSESEISNERPIVSTHTKGVSKSYNSIWLKQYNSGNLLDIGRNSAFVGKFEKIKNMVH